MFDGLPSLRFDGLPSLRFDGLPSLRFDGLNPSLRYYAPSGLYKSKHLKVRNF
jgi:hypothetical protein